MEYLQSEKKVFSWIKELNPIYKKAFWISLILINLTFLFHTVNFMFGDHDWNYVRSANYWSEGSFEGRPLHFVLQSLFFGGHVLPVLNNLLSLMAMVLSGLLLAHYWRIPKTVFNYTVFTVFIAVLPLTLVWLFYAKDTLINLSLPLIAIGALLFADRKISLQNIIYHILAIVLFYFAFASYVAVINLMAVCLLGNILISILQQTKIIEIIKNKLPVFLDILIAIILFKITLVLSPISSDYNTDMIPLTMLPQKLEQTLYVMFSQLIMPIPFMEYKYKMLLLILCGYGVIFASKVNIKRIPLTVFLVLCILFASKLAFFIANEEGKILAEMENFAYVPRLDFYGLAYVYALGLALVLSFTKKTWYKVGVILAVVLTFMSIVRDVYAQKVWKLGFDAEMKAHERIVGRLEQMPNFDAKRKYRLLQIGSLSLRKNYYHKASHEQVSLDLLETSFTPKFLSHIVYNFYYPEDIFYGNASINNLSATGREYLKTKAKAWPSKESIYIDNDTIVIILTQEDLDKARYQIQY